MKLEFDQTLEHIRDLQKNHFLKNKWLRRFGIFMIIMFAFNILGTFLMEEFKIENLISSVVPILVIGLLWWFLLRVGNIQMTSGKNKELLTGSRIVEFFEDKINYKTNILDTNYQWEAITSLKESDLCFYLYTGSSQALIIPKSAFKDDLQQQEFKELIKRNIKA